MLIRNWLSPLTGSKKVHVVSFFMNFNTEEKVMIRISIGVPNQLTTKSYYNL